MEYYTATEVDGILPFVETFRHGRHYANWNKSEKDKYCNDITSMRNLKNKPVSLKKKKEAGSQRTKWRLQAGGGGRQTAAGGGGTNYWIHDRFKGVLCNTGNIASILKKL